MTSFVAPAPAPATATATAPAPAQRKRPRFRLRLHPRLRPVFALLGCAALVACTPRYDWREIRAGEDRFVAMMPAKPARMTRAIDLDGMKVSMTMHGARVDDVAFTVGAVELPDASVAVREQAIAAMRMAMVRNIGGREREAKAVTVPVVDAGGAARGTAPGWRIEATGRAGDREVALLAVFASRNGRAWQAVVVGPSPDREQAAMFLDGFRVTD